MAHNETTEIAAKIDVSKMGDDTLNQTLRHALHLDGKHFHLTIGYLIQVPEFMALEIAHKIKIFLENTRNLKTTPLTFLIKSATTWHRRLKPWEMKEKRKANDKTIMLFPADEREFKKINQDLELYLQEFNGTGLELDWKTKGDEYVPHMKLGDPQGMSTHRAVEVLEHILHQKHLLGEEISFKGYSVTIRKRGIVVKEITD